MTIEYKDSKRIVGLSYTAGSEVGETSGSDETRTLGVSSSRYRGGIKIATGSALIGQTLSPTKGIKFELKRTGLSSGASVSRFEIWNDTTIISSATVTFDPPTKVGTSYAYVEFFPASTVTLQANDRITIATDGGATNYYTFKSNASGSYDTTKTHWTESTYNSGSGGSWTDDTGRDGNFKFTLADVGDVKPTDVQDNSIMVEKDTARRYWFSAGTAISFEDDYTSNSGWTQTGSKVTVDSGKSDWVDANAAATNDSLQQVIKSLGITLSDTAWTADFTYINNGGTVGGYPFVFQSGTGNYDSASNDAITMSEDNPNKIKINTKNGGTYVAGSSTIAVSSGTTYYIRIQRTSATDIKLSAFTDSARTTHTSGSPVTASNAGIANITGLTYVQHQNQTTGGGGTSNFEITDLKIYNNSTSAPTTATWTMQPTFQDDFSTNKGWTNLTSNTSVTTKLNYSEVSSTYIRATKDLQDSNALGSGNNMSDNFVIRFELNKTNDATNTANGTQPLIGISSATTDGWFNNQDSIGMLLSQDTNQTHGIRAVGADNQYTHQGDSADASYTWTTGIRYCEVIKNATADTVTATLYSDSNYSNSLVTATVSTSGKTFSGLRYLSMRNFADSGRSSTVWEMNNIQVYNGVTSIN